MNAVSPSALTVALAILASHAVSAQDCNCGTSHNHSQGAAASPASPYAGMQHRAVKALSEQQITDLRAGRGMGLSLPAELNGYPGPVHILELANALQLSDDQRVRTKALFEAMKAETIPIGERILSEETAVDRLFAARQVTRAALEEAVSRIAFAQGELRAAHLRYHLSMTDLLSPEQIARYAELRGYTTGGHHQR
jgi:Spy/CpxP family protein refolding chaperone